MLLAAIRAYKVFVSPYLAAGSCRFTPSCADYASQAIGAYGALRGTWLAGRRLARCRPWGGHGFDPIPQPDAQDASKRFSQTRRGDLPGIKGQSPLAR